METVKLNDGSIEIIGSHRDLVDIVRDKCGDDIAKIVDALDPAEMGEFHAYMKLIEEISLDKYVEIGEKTKETRQTVLEAIDKIYR